MWMGGAMFSWEPLFFSWMKTLPEVLEPTKPRIETMFMWMVNPCIKFIRRNCKELIPTADVNLPFALMNIIDR